MSYCVPTTTGATAAGAENSNNAAPSGAGAKEQKNTNTRCINPASEVNARLDTQVEVRVYPCNNSQSGGKKKFTTFNVKPEVRASLI